MPKKITNLLKSGLPAQIYLLCYTNPQTGYGLGKKIYKIEKGIPPTSKIYPWIKKLVEQKFLMETKEGYKARTEPLFLEITQMLKKNDPFTKREERLLSNLLESKEFRLYIEGWYYGFQRYNRLGPSQTIVGQDESFNAIRLIAETLGMLGTVSIIRNEFSKIPLEEDVEKLEKQYRKGKNPEEWIQQQITSLQQYNQVIRFFKKYSHEFLRKLSYFWPASDIILRSERGIYMQKYLKPENYGWRKI